METGRHIISIDLGFAAEPTALAVIEPKTDYRYTLPLEDGIIGTNSFEVRHLQKFQPGASVSEVADQVKELTSDRGRIPISTVLVNTSSSGPAPLKVFRERNIRLRAHTILNVAAESWTGPTQGVAKRSLIGLTSVLLQDDRLKVADSLELGKALLNELINFQMKPPKATDPLEAMREGVHGDLVFAVALGCWWGDRFSWEEEKRERMPLHNVEPNAFDYGRDSSTGY